jgi:hypothetical protein
LDKNQEQTKLAKHAGVSWIKGAIDNKLISPGDSPKWWINQKKTSSANPSCSFIF